MSQQQSRKNSIRKLSSQEQEECQQYKVKIYTKNKIEEYRQEVRQQQINQQFNKKRESLLSQQSHNNSQTSQSQNTDQQTLEPSKGIRTRFLKQNDIKFLEIRTENDNLVWIDFQDKQTFLDAADLNKQENTLINQTYNYLESYLKGEKQNFEKIIEKIDFQKLNATDFQIKVWKELLKIPYGQYITYKQLANNINQPSSVRAVANACGQNKISIIIPCHRVVGSDLTLTGYAGGLQRKQFLHNLEGIKLQNK